MRKQESQGQPQSEHFSQGGWMQWQRSPNNPPAMTVLAVRATRAVAARVNKRFMRGVLLSSSVAAEPRGATAAIRGGKLPAS
jgi:hypothetical protein